MKGLPLPKKRRDQDSEVITTQNLERYRKEIIRRGSKYRLPIINTSKRIVSLTIVILVLASLGFGSYVYLRLYRYQDNSDFIYQITTIFPLPVGRVGDDWLAYEDYLKELRRYRHYFETQQNVDFTDPANADQLTDLKQRSLQNVIDRSYVAQLAAEYQLSVSDEEVQAQLDLLQEQNKLASGQSLENVVGSFWGWSLADYRQSVADELLAQKLVARLDQRPSQQAQAIWQRAQTGEDFAQLAATYSEDLASAANGGEYDFLLDLSELNEDPRVLAAAFATPVGEVSPVINVGHRLEILKVIASESPTKRRVAHISFVFIKLKDIQNNPDYTLPIKTYIEL